MGPRFGLDRCGKSRSHRDSIPRLSSPKPVAIPTELPVHITCLRLLTMARLSHHILFVVQMILRDPEMPFYGLLFLLNKYATLGITARSQCTAKYPDLSSAIWHVSQSKFHTAKVCQSHVYWIRQM